MNLKGSIFIILLVLIALCVLILGFIPLWCEEGTNFNENTGIATPKPCKSILRTILESIFTRDDISHF